MAVKDSKVARVGHIGKVVNVDMGILHSSTKLEVIILRNSDNERTIVNSCGLRLLFLGAGRSGAVELTLEEFEDRRRVG